MIAPVRERRCPHCGTETDIERSGERSLPGGLRRHEFEILVRNEWRRRLGAEAYGRAHELRMIRTLTDIAMTGMGVGEVRELADEIDQLVADLAAAGKGRGAVRREVGKLVNAMRHVLNTADADSGFTERFTASAWAALVRALDYPRFRRPAIGNSSGDLPKG